MAKNLTYGWKFSTLLELNSILMRWLIIKKSFLNHHRYFQNCHRFCTCFESSKMSWAQVFRFSMHAVVCIQIVDNVQFSTLRSWRNVLNWMLNKNVSFQKPNILSNIHLIYQSTMLISAPEAHRIVGCSIYCLQFVEEQTLLHRHVMNGIFRVMSQSPLNKYVKAWKYSNLFSSLRCNALRFSPCICFFFFLMFCVVNLESIAMHLRKQTAATFIGIFLATKHKCVYLEIVYVLRRSFFFLWFKLNSLEQIKYKSLQANE